MGTIKSSQPRQRSLLDDQIGNKKFEFHKYSKFIKPSDILFPVEYLSLIDHIAIYATPTIRSKQLHDKTIEILQLFDRDIVDLRTDVDDVTHRKTWIIEHKSTGYMPLTSYGDGTKKIVAFAGKIASMNGGILLIDEFDTSIHTKAMEHVFTFLINTTAQVVKY